MEGAAEEAADEEGASDPDCPKPHLSNLRPSMNPSAANRLCAWFGGSIHAVAWRIMRQRVPRSLRKGTAALPGGNSVCLAALTDIVSP